MPKLLWHEDMISLMKVGQLCGHSCLRTETRTRFSLFRRVRSVRRLSSLFESWMMKFTTKFRIPRAVSGCKEELRQAAYLDTGREEAPST